MKEFNIRYGSKDEIDTDKFMLFSEDNDGNTIIVAENEGEIVGFAQLEGDIIGFMESIQKGAGRAMVEFLKEEYDHLVADRTDKVSAGFWERMGFEKTHSFRYEWWMEE